MRQQWRVLAALVRDGVIHYQDSSTPCGDYPYPLEMRLGVRSVMKSIGAPLALLRLAQVCGPYVLTLKIGDFVDGLDPKYRAVRFIDAANMATGFGGTGTWKTNPNDPLDGYLDGDYDAWYTAPSHREKVRQIRRSLRPYPWEPGTVMRYRDQDFYLLGVAIDRFVKAMRGPGADAWDMLRSEVFEPIGIAHAPVVRTREARNRRGLPWFNAGYYPTLDDLAKIALLYQSRGAYGGEQILHRGLTDDLLAGRGALPKRGDLSLGGMDADGELYKMGFHFRPYVGARGKRYYLPTMWGAGESEVILYPNGVVSIVIAKALELAPGETATSDEVRKPFGRWSDCNLSIETGPVMDSIPTVDVAPLFDTARTDWHVPDRALAAAARDIGFVCVRGMPGEAAPGPAERARLLAIFGLDETGETPPLSAQVRAGKPQRLSRLVSHAAGEPDFQRGYRHRRRPGPRVGHHRGRRSAARAESAAARGSAAGLARVGCRSITGRWSGWHRC